MRAGSSLVLGGRRPLLARTRVRGPHLFVLVAALCAMPYGMADAANTKGVREASYRAQVLPTGLGRLMVVKSDPGRGLCLALTLLHGPSGPRLPVDVAPPWRVEKVGAWLTGGDCDRAQISPPDGWARTASGTIRLRPDGDRCLIDLDVRVLFDARSGLRPVELMIASGVPFMEGEQPCGPRRGGAPPPPVRR